MECFVNARYVVKHFRLNHVFHYLRSVTAHGINYKLPIISELESKILILKFQQKCRTEENLFRNRR